MARVTYLLTRLTIKGVSFLFFFRRCNNMFNNDIIWAQQEFNEAYQVYTDVCHRVSLAHTDDEKKREADNLKKASDKFNEAYKKLKILQEHQSKEE